MEVEVFKSETFVPLAFFKKEAYTGSLRGMRYRVKREDDRLAAWVYPEPYSFEATGSDEKTEATFEFSEEGRQKLLGWLGNQYETGRKRWDKAGR